MGLIDRIWGVISSEKYDHVDQSLTIYVTQSSLDDLKKEYSVLSDENYESSMTPEQVTKQDLGFFFGATIKLSNRYLDGGFEIDEQI